MTPLRSICTFVAAGMVVAWTSVACGSPVFGPKEFLRSNGAPQEFVERFDLLGNASSFKLIVKNGLPDGTRRVSSAWVSLNGVQILAPSDFNQPVSEVRRPAMLLPTNELEIRVAGAPGGLLVVSISAVVGPGGGFLVTPGGARLTVPPGAVDGEVTFGMLDKSITDVAVMFPSGYSVVGAVSIDLGGAELNAEADLAIPAPDPIPERLIAARVLEDADARLLMLVDTASGRPDGYIHTDSPPFSGVRGGGTYAFAQIPSGLGIVGVDVHDEVSGNPVKGALVSVVTTSAGPSVSPELLSQALASQAAFVGQTDSTGFAGIPALPPDATVLAIASAPGASPSQLLVGTAGPLNTPIDLPFPLVGRITALIHQSISGGPLPQPPGPCPCFTLAVLPPEIPVGTTPTPFKPGSDLKLNVFCANKDVSSSTDFLSERQLLTLLVSGVDVNFTFYFPFPLFTSTPIVTVSSTGLVTAVRPGISQITVLVIRIRQVRFLGATFIQLCPATGAVSPVVVSASLHIATTGGGLGTVQSNPPGISCPPDCDASLQPESTVILTATQAPGSHFVRWGGDCEGATPTITVGVQGDLSCTAEFHRQLIFEDDFSPQKDGVWSFMSPTPGFLGPLNDNVNVPGVTLTIPDSGGGTLLQWDLLAFDTLDGFTSCCTDTLEVRANGTLLLSAQLHGGFPEFSRILENPAGGSYEALDGGRRYRFTVPLAIERGPLAISWNYSHLQNILDESWGLDNVVLRAW